MEERICSRCEKILDKSKFKIKNLNTGELTKWCIDCLDKQLQYSKENTERVNGYKEKYYLKNRDKIVATYENNKNTVFEKTKALIHDSRVRAEEKNFKFDLGFDNILTRIKEGKCEKTGISFNIVVDSKKRGPWNPSLNRKNNTGGYTEDNIEVVAWSYNNMIANMDDQEIDYLLVNILNSGNYLKGSIKRDFEILEKLTDYKLKTRDEKLRLTTKYCSARDRAKKKNLDFNLGNGFLMNYTINGGVCQRTGIRFMDYKNPVRYRQNPWSPSLDRVDNTKGYTKDNTEVVCWGYNRAKSELTSEEFNILVVNTALKRNLIKNDDLKEEYLICIA